MELGFSKRDIFAFTLIAIAAFLLLSIFTYDVRDPSFNNAVHSSQATSATQNTVGIIGSYTSDIVLQFFGLSAFVIPMIMIAGAVLLVITRKKPFPLLKTVLFFALLFTLTISLDLIIRFFNYGGERFFAGGLFGKLVSDMSINLLSRAGAIILGLTLTLVLFSFLSNISLLTIMMFFAYGLLKLSKATLLVLKKTYEYSVVTYAWVREVLRKRQQQVPVEEAVPVPKKTAAKVASAEDLDIYDEDDFQVEEKISPKVYIPRNKKYKLPPVSLLKTPPRNKNVDDAAQLKAVAQALQARLVDFGVQGEITAVNPGPVITMYEFKPAPGVKINKVANLSDDLALALGCGSLRVIAPIPGKSVIGIEVPNKNRETVYLRELIDSQIFKSSSMQIPVAMGKDTEGETYVTDLAKMPHLLVAGTTGSGKSVFINALICSILYRFSPQDVRMILVDPKMLELSVYNDIPHLLLPVVTEAPKASQALKWAVREMVSRYEILSESGARNITSYNQNAEIPMPYIVIIVDELADLMMVCSKDVESSITRLAQMARAAGIHIVLATQRPSVDVITGLIKANFPSRVSFKVSSKIDSRTILDSQGAEKLLGMGDMLYIPPGITRLNRLHGAFVSDEEVNAVVNFVRQQGTPDYQIQILEAEEEENTEGFDAEDSDPLYDEAVKVVVESKKASISYVQRRLKIGYNRAARMIETMEAKGIVSAQSGAGNREVLVDNI